MAVEFRTMQQRRGSAAQWAANDVVLKAGELGLSLGPAAGEVHLKVGDGVTLYSVLPFVLETDPVARASIASLDAEVTSIDSRVTVLETAIGSGGAFSDLAAQVAANTSQIAIRQLTLPSGASPGDVLHWDGTAYSATALSPAPVLGTILYWNPTTGAYVGTAPGAVGQAMILLPGGIPGWGNPSAITGTVSNTSIPLAGGASVQAAFNAAAPTIAPDEIATVTWEGRGYHYIGPAGIAITTATAAHFTLLGWFDVIAEAPVDGTRYARKDAAWEAIPSGGIAEAPVDGKTYGRKDAAWVELVATYDLHFDFGVAALTANAERAAVVARAFTIPADLVGSRVSTGGGDASAPVLTLYDDGVAIATLTLGTSGGTWAAVTPATPIVVAAGSLVVLRAPGTISTAFTAVRAAVAATRN